MNELDGWTCSVEPMPFTGSTMVVAIGAILGFVLGLAMSGVQ